MSLVYKHISSVCGYKSKMTHGYAVAIGSGLEGQQRGKILPVGRTLGVEPGCLPCAEGDVA